MLKFIKILIILILFVFFEEQSYLFAKQQDDSLKIKIQLEIKTGKVIIPLSLFAQALPFSR